MVEYIRACEAFDCNELNAYKCLRTFPIKDNENKVEAYLRDSNGEGSNKRSRVQEFTEQQCG